MYRILIFCVCIGITINAFAGARSLSDPSRVSSHRSNASSSSSKSSKSSNYSSSSSSSSDSSDISGDICIGFFDIFFSGLFAGSSSSGDNVSPETSSINDISFPTNGFIPRGHAVFECIGRKYDLHALFPWVLSAAYKIDSDR